MATRAVAFDARGVHDVGSSSGRVGTWHLYHQAMAEIRIMARKRSLQFAITNPPLATVAGQVHELRWGQETVVSVPEGTHELAVHFLHTGMGARGKASLTVQAATPGPLVRYQSPVMLFNRGTLDLA